jgi:hypothetical protein
MVIYLGKKLARIKRYEVREDEMGGECGANEGDEECV